MGDVKGYLLSIPERLVRAVLGLGAGAVREAGNAVEVLGIVAFRASPVWVLAALADVCGVGRQLIPEIADALKAKGLLEQDAQFGSMDELLDGSSGHRLEWLRPSTRRRSTWPASGRNGRRFERKREPFNLIAFQPAKPSAACGPNSRRNPRVSTSRSSRHRRR